MGGLIDTILPLVRSVAEKLEGSEFAEKALGHVRAIEAIAARHASALDAEIVQWWADITGLTNDAEQAAEGAHAAPADPAEPVA